MTYEEIYTSVKKAAKKSVKVEDSAVSIYVNDENNSGEFYIAVDGGKVVIENFKYNDYTAHLSISSADLKKIVDGKEVSYTFDDGDAEKGTAILTAVLGKEKTAKKAPAKKAEAPKAAEKAPAKKEEAPKAAEKKAPAKKAEAPKAAEKVAEKKVEAPKAAEKKAPAKKAEAPKAAEKKAPAKKAEAPKAAEKVAEKKVEAPKAAEKKAPAKKADKKTK